MWICSLGHELCHSVRMSDSPGQGLGRVWGCFVCPQLSSDKDRLLSLLSKEDKKASPRQEGRLCPVEEAGPACLSLAPTASTEKQASPQGPILLVEREWRGSGGQAPGALGNSRFSTRTARSKEAQLGQEGGRGWEKDKLDWVLPSPNRNHKSLAEDAVS